MSTIFLSASNQDAMETDFLPLCEFASVRDRFARLLFGYSFDREHAKIRVAIVRHTGCPSGMTKSRCHFFLSSAQSSGFVRVVSNRGLRAAMTLSSSARSMVYTSWHRRTHPHSLSVGAQPYTWPLDDCRFFDPGARTPASNLSGTFRTRVTVLTRIVTVSVLLPFSVYHRFLCTCTCGILWVKLMSQPTHTFEQQ